MKKKNLKQKNSKFNLTKILTTILILLCLSILEYFYPNIQSILMPYEPSNFNSYTLQEIPEYSGNPYIIINDNIPNFDEQDYYKDFEIYSELDNLGRCGVAYANICKRTMPPKGDMRDDISSVKPSGWKQKRYNREYLYNRCHLIGYQLSDEDDNKLNLITGTRYFNVQGMLPFENEVANYINLNIDNHVLYRVTPIFKDTNLVANRCPNGSLFS